ncbi:MAG: mechanosensitive ion channel [Chloroflexi bacterium]|nr:mechanosensitive ion channel [Chloroflexota bacterium]
MLPTAVAQQQIDSLSALVLTQWINWLNALVTVVVAVIVRRIALNWSGSAMRRARVDTGTQILVKRGLTIAFVVVTGATVLGILGVSPAALVTLLGAVGLAFSLAMQDILKNFFSGVYLLLERPFRVGDSISVKDQHGIVENIGVRTTRLRTPDNVLVLVPNMVVFAEVVAKRSHAAPGVPAAAGADGRGTDAPVR